MLAFCPLDLPKVIVDEDLVNHLIDYYNPGHHDGIWETLPLLGRVSSQEDFSNAPEFEKAWEKRYDNAGNILININVYEKLKPIFDQFERLPLTVTHAQILRATKDIPKHHDMKHKNGEFIDDRPDITYEPNGFKIILNHLTEKSFFISNTFDSEKIYFNYPADTNTFVINEKSFPHGSTYIKNKCIVSIFGLVDKNHMDYLIAKSAEKYKKYVIEF